MFVNFIICYHFILLIFDAVHSHINFFQFLPSDYHLKIRMAGKLYIIPMISSITKLLHIYVIMKTLADN